MAKPGRPPRAPDPAKVFVVLDAWAFVVQSFEDRQEAIAFRTYRRSVGHRGDRIATYVLSVPGAS